jgi:hypothetical protein
MVTIAAARIAAVPVLLCGSGIEPLGTARTQLKRTLCFQTNREIVKFKVFCL